MIHADTFQVNTLKTIEICLASEKLNLFKGSQGLQEKLLQIGGLAK